MCMETRKVRIELENELGTISTLKEVSLLQRKAVVAEWYCTLPQDPVLFDQTLHIATAC
jgi:hypothetical protein